MEKMEEAWLKAAAAAIVEALQAHEADPNSLLDGIPDEISAQLPVESQNGETLLVGWLQHLEEVDRRALVGDQVWGYTLFENAAITCADATVARQLRTLQREYYRRFCS